MNKEYLEKEIEHIKNLLENNLISNGQQLIISRKNDRLSFEITEDFV